MSVQHGVAHVGGRYPTMTGGASHLTRGATDIKALGSNAMLIKTYLSPGYATTDYPQDVWGGGISSLTTLAQATQYAALLADTRWTTHFLTCFSFANGVNNPWQSGVNASMLAAEKAEMQALTTHLLTTYAGSGKTFVLQQWEGDWALIGAFDETAQFNPQRSDWYAAFLRARQEGVEAGRRATGQAGVRVLHCVEANRVIDARLGRRRLVNSVLPKVRPDVVSYSAYEATVYNLGGTQQQALDSMALLLPQALGMLKDACPDALISLGEFGFAEAELNPAFNPATLIQQVIDLANAAGCTHSIYWQIFDNEVQLDGVTPRGFYLRKPDGSLSGAGTKYAALFA